MKEILSNLQEARKKLPQSGVREDDIEIRVVRGYNRGVEASSKGVYYFVERIDSRGEIHILTQDTMTTPVVKGVVLTNGQIEETTGIDDLGEERDQAVNDLLKGFISCQAYMGLSTGEKTGIHHSSDKTSL